MTYETHPAECPLEHKDPNGWVKTKSKYADRKRYECRNCGRFIGYLPPEALENQTEPNEDTPELDLWANL